MQVNFKIETLGGRIYDFTVDDETNVHQLKEKLAERTHINADRQRLIYCGQVLSDDSQLKDYCIDGEVIFAAERAPPSSYSGFLSSRYRYRDTMLNLDGMHNLPRCGIMGSMPMGTIPMNSNVPPPPASGFPSPRFGDRETQVNLDRMHNLPRFGTISSMPMGTIPANSNVPQLYSLGPNTTVSSSSSSSICKNRTTITRHMIECANNIASYLEETVRGPSNTALNVLPRSPCITEPTVVEADISAPGLPKTTNISKMVDGALSKVLMHPSANEQQNTERLTQSASTSASSHIEAQTAENRTSSATVEDIPEDAREADNTTNNFDTEMIQNGAENTTQGAVETQTNQQESSCAQGRSDKGKRALVEVINEMRRVQTRLEPFMQGVLDMLNDDLTSDDNGTATRRNSQCLYDCMSEAMHYMSHAQHIISDSMLDFASPMPRLLTCRPGFLERSVYNRFDSGFSAASAADSATTAMSSGQRAEAEVAISATGASETVVDNARSQVLQTQLSSATYNNNDETANAVADFIASRTTNDTDNAENQVRATPATLPATSNHTGSLPPWNWPAHGKRRVPYDSCQTARKRTVPREMVSGRIPRIVYPYRINVNATSGRSRFTYFHTPEIESSLQPPSPPMRLSHQNSLASSIVADSGYAGSTRDGHNAPVIAPVLTPHRSLICSVVNKESAAKILTQMHKFLASEVFENGLINEDTISKAQNRVEHWFNEFFSTMFSPYEGSGYNARMSVLSLLRHSLLVLVRYVQKAVNLNPPLRSQAGLHCILNQFTKRLFKILVVCSGRTHAEVRVPWGQLMHSIKVKLESVFVGEAFQFLCRYTDTTIIPFDTNYDDIQKFIVHRNEDQTESIETFVSPPPSFDLQPTETNVDTMVDATSSSIETKALDTEPEKLPADLLPDVNVGTEPWHSSFPADWLPTIASDQQTQAEQPAQQPFSEAYISGMSVSQRKRLQSNKTRPTNASSLIQNVDTSESTNSNSNDPAMQDSHTEPLGRPVCESQSDNSGRSPDKAE